MAGALLAQKTWANLVESVGNRPIKIGIVGCGGRGMGAAADALEATPQTIIWAMADVFESQMTAGITLLTSQYGKDRILVPPSRQFSGLTGYQKLVLEEVDIVLLCSPPVFRPQHINACIDANKHLFAEKPIAVDVPGALSVLAASKRAQEKKLLTFDGFCWRFDLGCQAAMKELYAGTFGKPLSFTGIYYAAPPKTPMTAASRPAAMTDVEWAIKNWTGWNWLSGGSFVEQVIHTIDLMSWAFNEELPLAAIGSGGRAQRQDQGDVWDHYQVTYELPNRKRATLSSRQWTQCYCDISDRIICEKGTLITPYRPRFEGETRWRYSGEPSNMFRETHKAIFCHFTKNSPPAARPSLAAAAQKTLIAILGRMAAETGQRITWEDMLKSTKKFLPENLSLNSPLPPPHIVVPGEKA